MIDLHTHSRFSDGTESPEYIVGRAASAGVKMLALTDHDTLDGLPSFMKAAEKYPGLIAVPGIELSANDVDLLALGITKPRSLEDYRNAMKTEELPLKEVMDVALALGAVPVLPHAVHTGKRGAALEELVEELKGYGLMGIECFHPDHSKAVAEECLALARRHGLLVICGSDYHGAYEPTRKIGYYGEGDWENCPELEETRAFFKEWLEKGDGGVASRT